MSRFRGALYPANLNCLNYYSSDSIQNCYYAALKIMLAISICILFN